MPPQALSVHHHRAHHKDVWVWLLALEGTASIMGIQERSGGRGGGLSAGLGFLALPDLVFSPCHGGIDGICTKMAVCSRDVARRLANRAPLWRFGRETSLHLEK